MIDFIVNALPWFAIGVIIALIMTGLTVKNRRKTQAIHIEIDPSRRTMPQKKETDETPEDYMVPGMLLGLALGAAIGCVLLGIYGVYAFPYGLCFGLLLGTAGGLMVKKNS